MEKRPGESLENWKIAVRDGHMLTPAVGESLFAEIDALTSECDDALKTCFQAGGLVAELRRDLALSQEREKSALRRGFYAAQEQDDDRGTKFPDWEDYEKHLAEEAEHATTLGRIAEGEEKEK